MRLVSPLLKHVVYPGLSKAGYLRRATGAGPAVLTYHGVLPTGYNVIDPALDGSLVSVQAFRRQLGFLGEQYNVISPGDFLRWCEGRHELPPRSVLLTCDDGLRNSLYDMLPILQEFQLSCLFFVTGASLDPTPTMLWYEELHLMLLRAPEGFALALPEIELRAEVSAKGRLSLWWTLVKRLSRHEVSSRRTLLERIRMQLGLPATWGAEYREHPVLGRRFSVLTRSEVCQLAEAGMFVGAHTLSHPVLSQSPPDTAWTEISESKGRLERALGREIWALAYPFGDPSSVTSREFQMAERAGFKGAFLNAGGGFGARNPKFALPRVHITAAMSLVELEAHISGLHRSLRELFASTGLRAARSTA